MVGGRETKSVVILGGGTAGWLTAAYLASKLNHGRQDVAVTLIEAPGIAPLGVGEGTWPTMRGTLAAIGIGEHDFLSCCDGSFKQGSRFDGWIDGTDADSYLHPFSPPIAGDIAALLAGAQSLGKPFANAVSAQAAICARDLAPRQIAMPDYAGAVNYAYHFDAGKFATLLSRHATERLCVRHIADQVVAVRAHDDGDIASLATSNSGDIAGDLFIDCSGQAGLLIGQHFGIGWIDRSDVMFNDTALALQVPVSTDSAIAAQTIATAHASGWIWDIGLPGRRGIGCVFASRFCSEDRARSTLLDYVARMVPSADLTSLTPRRLAFETGYRRSFWHRNCLAIGQSAGFIEPMEASAIVMIELSLRALVENFPSKRGIMDFVAERFNSLFHYRWERIVEFLKLHYLLSRRDGAYWQAHRDPQSIPERLAKLVELWRGQPPSLWDFPHADEIFSAASHQYILYGMGAAAPSGSMPNDDAMAQIAEVERRSRILVSSLPSNRAYADAALSNAAGKETI